MTDEAATPPEEETPESAAEEPTAEAAQGDSADTSSAAEPAATPEPSAEDSGSEAEQPSVSDEAEQPSVDDEPAAQPEPSAAEEPSADAAEEKAVPSVPGADLEPIALEDTENLSAEERARLEAEAEEERARREAELAAEKADEDIPVREPAKLDKDARFRATGKRKSAIARVILKPGSGEVTVNGRPLEEYFPRPLHQTMVRQPLVTSGYNSSLEVLVRVHGGGISGQASAVRHGVARALTEIDAELRGDLKRRGYLTRDARVKERRKAGFKKARKRPQFSKR